jgi:hypothetical protein
MINGWPEAFLPLVILNKLKILNICSIYVKILSKIEYDSINNLDNYYI